jgi:hypothetical protein
MSEVLSAHASSLHPSTVDSRRRQRSRRPSPLWRQAAWCSHFLQHVIEFSVPDVFEESGGRRCWRSLSAAWPAAPRTRRWPRDKFADKYSCASAVASVPEPGGTVRVSGCGYDATYDCGDDQLKSTVDAEGRVGATRTRDCGERYQLAYEATDGSRHPASLMDEVPSGFAAAKEAAVASAAHDLRCAPASVVVMGGDSEPASILEGCGARLTYNLVDVPTAPGRVRQVAAKRYVLTGRLAIPAPTAPYCKEPYMTPAMPEPRKTMHLLIGALTLLACSGCSLQSRAVTAASTAWSCPEDRIQVAPVDIPLGAVQQPPPEIAADPARLAIWRKGRPDPSDLREFSASGCGKTGAIECRYAYDYVNQGLHWVCAVPNPLIVDISGRVDGLGPQSGVVGATPEALEALAAQMDASGQATVAEALRAKAQQLRAGGAGPVPGGGTSSVTGAPTTPSSGAASPSPAPGADLR